MAKTRSMTRKENRDASMRKRFKTCDANDGPTPWSDLDHDLLFLVMMQLGVVDFVTFSGVCKSWRSLALCNRNKFMVSRPPMSISIHIDANDNHCYCNLKEFEGKMFKTTPPHSGGRTCIGFTCGYLVLFGRETRDFWLVNPITRHELHFPVIPSLENYDPSTIRAKLVYSPLISGLVFVVLNKFTGTLSFSVAGTSCWNHVTSSRSLNELHAFKGKIYIITTHRLLCELRLGPQPKVTLLKIKNRIPPNFSNSKFLNSDENFYVICHNLLNQFKIWELDFGQKKWVSPEKKTTEEYDWYVKGLMNCYAIKPESWADPTDPSRN